MLTKIVDFQEVIVSGRWRVELFTDIATAIVESRWPLVTIRELADESSEAISPAECDSDTVLYVGLENVEPVTGEPVGLELREKTSVKSRSKVFKAGDILYGRLRPYLRKAFLAGPPFQKGICSTEFIVLTPNKNAILPEVLRAMLVSKQLTDELARFQIGAALPRISSRDFFSLELPLPPLAIQGQWAKKLFELSVVVRKARQQIQSFPNQLDGFLSQMIIGA